MKIAITGVNSYLATTILPLLENDSAITEIIGIDIRPWKGSYSKVKFHRMDIRSKDIYDLLDGVEVMFHLAFIVGEIHDKKKTYDVNINGSRNVFEACVKNGVRKVIYSSSMTVYGSHPSNPLGYTEVYSIKENTDSYYNSSKVKVENFAVDFFKQYPNMILTVLRVGLICGPNISNMFSDLWSKKIAILPMGRNSHNQLIHEEDLGVAFQKALMKNIPGIYNVCADDALATRWMFKKAGVRLIYLPSGLLKFILNILFFLRIEKVSQGWVSLSEYTIYGRCDKFKKATSWEPKYTSEETFNQFLETKKRDTVNSLKHSFLTQLYTTPKAIALGLSALNAILFAIEKTPWLRNITPLTNPQKNNITYLPINKNIVDRETKKIAINKSLGETSSEIIPHQILDDLIDLFSTHIVMDHCICRTGFSCENYTNEIGCLFMGETAKKLPPGLGRRVSKNQAHKHVVKAIELGLVPMTGKVNVDNLGFLTPDTNELLSVCFCCHCCCMMGYYKHDKGHLKKLFKPVEGLNLVVTDNCVGCGSCIETCIYDNIKLKEGKAFLLGHCVGCGRCEMTCSNNGIEISMDNPEFKEDVKARLQKFVKIS